ncbi:hypothetical protein [Marinitoga litoralis]|uniref:hypothetical protein n=1 Tax=Marinitoga litoralis TaxID=570855 RepID=UPI0019600D41|nr:hypothetical protein [Marinitoga litoralis]MBM7560455.1 hypothetical protein [Marinitoga litoralis]
MLEKEWKYFIKDETEISKIKENSKKVGIIQWYLKSDENKEERIRLELIPQRTGIMKKWIKTIKEKTDDPEVRIEDENTFLPKSEDIHKLYHSPVVLKIRYIYNDDPEIVLDEYFEIKDLLEYDIKEKYILEVEEKSKKVDFDSLKEYGISSFQKLTEEEMLKYKNKNIAKYLKNEGIKSIKELNDFIENKLIGDITVVMPVGTSFKNYIERNSEKGKELEFLKGLTFENIDKSAELQTLDILKNKGFNINKVILFIYPPFEDISKEEVEKLGLEYEDGLNKIYYYLKYASQKFFGIDVEYRKVNFDTENIETSKNTFNEIWKYLDEIFKKEKEVIIDIAPGIKYIGIIMALYALFNRKSFYYKYERQFDIVKIPAFGIDWDYNYIDELNAIFKSYNNTNFEEIINMPKELYEILNIRDNEILPFYPIDKIINSFKEKREMPFGYGERYFDLIENENLKKYLKHGIIKKWSQMWIGDQIPETVEHSQRHSKRLMEFTVNLINTIGEDEFLKPFKDEELNREYIKNITYKDLIYFLLGVSINVHDLGHTYPMFKDRNGNVFYLDSLPSLVRDLHNELTLQLIEDFNYDVLAIENDFEGISLRKIFRDKTLEVVSSIKMICKYHRGYLGVDKESDINNKDFVKIMNLDTRKLEDVFNPEDELLKKITMYLAKWLKFIDGTDVQADRVVTENYHKNRLERTKNEIIYLIDKLKSNYEINDNYYNSINIIKDKLSKHTKIHNEKELIEDMKLVEKEAEKLEQYVYENIDNINNMLELIDKIAFKARQFSHFNKHKSVSAVIPEWLEYSNKDNNKKLHIKLIKNIEVSEIDNAVLKKIKKDINDEFNNSNLTKDIDIKEVVISY